MREIFRLAGVVFLLSLSLYAQTLGTITGEVRDPSGASVPNGAVTATNTGTSAARNTVTTDQGLFSFPGLVPGNYEVKVAVAGFRPSARTLTLEVQQTARVDFKLEVGQVSSAVEVSALATLLTTENATVGTVIENRRIVDLPLNGRNYLQLVSLSPNVSYGVGSSGAAGRVGGARANMNMSISGMRTVWNNYTLDGVPNNDPNILSYAVLPSVDMLQEFKVQSGIYPAEFGREATQINVSTKGGSNQFHGAAYEFVRNDKFDAKSYAFTTAQATQTKNPFQWNQYGFVFGGPVRIPKIYNGKDKLFFNSNYEWFRQVTRANNYYTVPSMAMRQGDFSELLPGNQLWDPIGRTLAADGKTVLATPFSGNKVPMNRQSYQSGVLWEFWPEPNKPSESTTSLFRNLYEINRGKINRDQFHLRLDFIESSNSAWFGRYSWSDEVELSTGIKLNGSKVATQPRQYMISNTRTLSPTLVNEFRFGITSLFNTTGTELAGVRNVIGELKIPGLVSPDANTWGIPRMGGFPGLDGFGNGSDGPYVMHTANFQGSDNVSLIRGRHTFRFGGEARRDRFNNLGNEFGRGAFDFQGYATQDPIKKTGGSAVADFIMGYTNQAEAAVANAFHQFRSTGMAYYVDDSWRVSTRLTLSLGLRYELTLPWVDRSQHYVNLAFPGYFFNIVNVPDKKLHPTMVREGSGDFWQGVPFRWQGNAIQVASDDAIQVARDGRLGGRMVVTDYNNFAPRLGIAWSPTEKWSVRAGAGIFYSQDIANPNFDMSRTLAGRARQTGRTDFPDVTMANFLATGTVGGQFILPASPYTWAAEYDARTTYSVNYILNVQRQLSASTMLELGYTGSISRHLQGLFDANAPVPSADGSTPSSRAPFPELGVVQTLYSTGRGNYNGGSVKITRRMAAGLTVLASYTISKSIDNVSGIRGQGDPQSPNDSRCLRCERGVSGFNKPNRFVASLVYELPFGKGKPLGSNWNPVLNQIGGGWQVSSIITFESGGVSQGGNQGGRSTLGYVLGERSDATGQPLNLPKDQRSVNAWFNPNAFALPPLGAVGNAGRNNVLGPGRKAWDFSAQKSFRILEGHSLDFRFEAFNFWNHPVWGMPSLGWGSSNPAKPSASYDTIRGTAYPMRQMQLGLKYVF